MSKSCNEPHFLFAPEKRPSDAMRTLTLLLLLRCAAAPALTQEQNGRCLKIADRET